MRSMERREQKKKELAIKLEKIKALLKEVKEELKKLAKEQII